MMTQPDESNQNESEHENHPLSQEHMHEAHVQHADLEQCQEMLSTLCDYVDGDLSAELCADLERHMQECQRCRVVVNTLKKTIELYQETAEDSEMPEEVRERLYLKLDLDKYLK